MKPEPQNQPQVRSEEPAAPQSEIKDLDKARAEATSEGEKKGVIAERKRVKEINSAVRKAGLDQQLADDCVEKGLSADETRALVLDKLAERSEKEPIENSTRVEGGDLDEIKTRRDSIAAAMLVRFDRNSFKHEKRSENFAHLSFVEICRKLVPNSDHLPKYELASRALTTSDLSEITSNAVNKVLTVAYGGLVDTYSQWTTPGEFTDMKERSVIDFGAGPQLLSVSEGAEFQDGPMADSAEKYKLGKYGRKVLITWETIVNDDLGAFLSLPRRFGIQAMSLNHQVVYGVLEDNANMSDGIALFHASHGNLGSAGEIAEGTLSELRQKMRDQKVDGAFVNLEPKFLITGTAKEGVARQYLSTEVVPTAASAARTMMHLQPIVDPNISGNKYFVVGDPMNGATVEVGFFQGMTGPIVETKQDFEKDGICHKIKHLVAAKSAGYRNMAKNAGA